MSRHNFCISMCRPKFRQPLPFGGLGNLTNAIASIIFRSNNIMFSYKDDQLAEDDDPIIIDYQLVNYGHPAYDLVWLFYRHFVDFFVDHVSRLQSTFYSVIQRAAQNKLDNVFLECFFWLVYYWLV